MFELFKKAFSIGAKDKGEAIAPNSRMAHGPVSEWAAARGLGFSVDPDGTSVSLEGKVKGRPWRLQVGSASRAYIHGAELRARAELGIHDDVSVLVINRPLKDALEKQAFSMYTDSLQTSVDSRMPEEMRWLAMYDEVGWEGLPKPFWNRYAVLTDKRDYAIEWINAKLAAQMLDWPSPGPGLEVPFLILMLSGKAYLRMEYSPASMPTLEHASRIFTTACEAALASLPPQTA